MDAAPSTARWELYRLLAEPVRLRLLALAGEEELAIGELAELLREGQPNVSRHVAPLRKAGLLSVRKHGTRVLVRLSERADADPVVRDGVGAGRDLCDADPVVRDGVGAGRDLCEGDGSLARVPEIVAQRDASAREFFGAARPAERDPAELPAELPAYLSALAPLIDARGLAVDVGTGAGFVLDVLAPLFDKVIAVDREAVQLELAEARLAARGYSHVSLVCDSFDGPELGERVAALGGADVVFASRVLHHSPKPAAAVEALARLLRPGGALLVLDYAPHEDEGLREQQADLWLGFSAKELEGFAKKAGLRDTTVRTIPRPRCGDGPDAEITWQCMVARRPK